MLLKACVTSRNGVNHASSLKSTFLSLPRSESFWESSWIVVKLRNNWPAGKEWDWPIDHISLHHWSQHKYRLTSSLAACSRSSKKVWGAMKSTARVIVVQKETLIWIPPVSPCQEINSMKLKFKWFDRCWGHISPDNMILNTHDVQHVSGIQGWLSNTGTPSDVNSFYFKWWLTIRFNWNCSASKLENLSHTNHEAGNLSATLTMCIRAAAAPRLRSVWVCNRVAAHHGTGLITLGCIVVKLPEENPSSQPKNHPGSPEKPRRSGDKTRTQKIRHALWLSLKRI